MLTVDDIEPMDYIDHSTCQVKLEYWTDREGGKHGFWRVYKKNKEGRDVLFMSVKEDITDYIEMEVDKELFANYVFHYMSEAYYKGFMDCWLKLKYGSK